MKRLVLTFLSTAPVWVVISLAPAAAQDTVTGAPAGEAPVTVEGYGTSSGPTAAAPPTVEGYWNPSEQTGGAASNSDPTDAIEPPDRCRVFRDFNDAEARDTVLCSP